MVSELLEELAALEYGFEFPKELGLVQYNDLPDSVRLECGARKRAALIIELLLKKGVIEQ